MAERIDFTFVGQTNRPLSLDPAEFTGMTVPTITAEIKRTLRDIAPDVSFFEDDIVLAADVLAGAATDGAGQ